MSKAKNQRKGNPSQIDIAVATVGYDEITGIATCPVPLLTQALHENDTTHDHDSSKEAVNSLNGLNVIDDVEKGSTSEMYEMGSLQGI